MKIQGTLNTERNMQRAMTCCSMHFVELLKFNITTQAQEEHRFTVFPAEVVTL